MSFRAAVTQYSFWGVFFLINCFGPCILSMRPVLVSTGICTLNRTSTSAAIWNSVCHFDIGEKAVVVVLQRKIWAFRVTIVGCEYNTSSLITRREVFDMDSPTVRGWYLDLGPALPRQRSSALFYFAMWWVSFQNFRIRVISLESVT